MKDFNTQMKSEAGFSLVELMIVVAIIGLLATVAVPRFEIFRAKARQVEAKNNLSHIYTLQHAFFGDNENFAAIAQPVGYTDGGGCVNPQNPLGFYLSPCDNNTISVRYRYTSTPGAGAAANQEFDATATSGTAANNKIVPGCATADVWSIDEQKALSQLPANNAIQQCSN